MALLGLLNVHDLCAVWERLAPSFKVLQPADAVLERRPLFVEWKELHESTIQLSVVSTQWYGLLLEYRENLYATHKDFKEYQSYGAYLQSVIADTPADDAELVIFDTDAIFDDWRAQWVHEEEQQQRRPSPQQE